MKSILPKTIELWKAPISPAYFEAKDQTERSVKITIMIFGWAFTAMMFFLFFASHGFLGQVKLTGILKALAASAFMATVIMVFIWLLNCSRYLRPTIYLKDKYIQIAGVPNSIIPKRKISAYYFTKKKIGEDIYDCAVVATSRNEEHILPYEGARDKRDAHEIMPFYGVRFVLRSGYAKRITN